MNTLEDDLCIPKPLFIVHQKGRVMKSKGFTFRNWNMRKWSNVYLLIAMFVLIQNNMNAQVSFVSNDENGTNLPSVDLVFFSVVRSGSNHTLNWSTATEYNNDFFTIEKSINGVNYETIGYKEAIGNSNEQSNYLLIDRDVTSVINYYRIKHADNDGRVNVLDELVIGSNSNRIALEVVSTTNLLGEEVGHSFRGEVIVMYLDGTSGRKIQ